MPIACSTVFRQRVCHFPSCGAVFYLCPHCDRGQRYCTSRCREKSRRLQRREANRRYHESLGSEGRLDHCQRQREYRQRLKARVTDQSSLAAQLLRLLDDYGAAQKMHYPWQNFHDQGEIDKAFGARAVPRTIVVDPEGEIAFDKVSPTPLELRAAIAKLGPAYAQALGEH